MVTSMNRISNSGCHACKQRDLVDDIQDIFSSESFARIEDFITNLNSIVKELQDRLECFDDVLLLKECQPETGLYQIAAAARRSQRKIPNLFFIREEDIIPDDYGLFAIREKIENWAQYKGLIKNPEKGIIEIPPTFFDKIDSLGLNVFQLKKEAQNDMINTLSTLVQYSISMGYIIRIYLRSRCIILLIFSVPLHDCRFSQSKGSDCIHRTDDQRNFIKYFANRISIELESVFYLQKVLREKERQVEFFEIAAHTLSLPLESALIDAANIKDSSDLSQTSSNDCQHLINELRYLDLQIRNILQAEEKTCEKPIFKKVSLLSVIREAVEIFRPEAEHKGCDIFLLIKINGKEIRINWNDILDEYLLYKRLLYEPIMPAYPDSREYLAKGDIKTMIKIDSSIEECLPEKLPYKCYKCLNNKNSKMEAIIRIKNTEMNYDISNISKFYLPDIELSYNDIFLAFKNLIHNAVKYSYKKVPSGDKRYIEIIVEWDDNYYKITVTNYGVGIKKHELDKGLIFRPRYRGENSTDMNRQGAGLGLSIVKKSLDIHGGIVKAQSLFQGGPYLNIFEIWIPIKFRSDMNVK